MRISFFPSHSIYPSFSRDPITFPLDWRKWIFKELCSVTDFHYDMADDHTTYIRGKQATLECEEVFQELFSLEERKEAFHFLTAERELGNLHPSQFPSFISNYI